MDKQIQKQNVGNAGEYYIASRLSSLDYIVTITLGRAERYDILALSPEGKLVKVSVKTTQRKDATGFPLSVRDEQYSSENFYYAFVRLKYPEEDPDYWIIPSSIVCDLIRSSHQNYLNTPGKNENSHKDSSIRKLPITLTEGIRQYYPKDWELIMDRYYKNFNLLNI
jgi:hypothetical protein